MHALYTSTSYCCDYRSDWGNCLHQTCASMPNRCKLRAALGGSRHDCWQAQTFFIRSRSVSNRRVYGFFVHLFPSLLCFCVTGASTVTAGGMRLCHRTMSIACTKCGLVCDRCKPAVSRRWGGGGTIACIKCVLVCNRTGQLAAPKVVWCETGASQLWAGYAAVSQDYFNCLHQKWFGVWQVQAPGCRHRRLSSGSLKGANLF